MNYISSGLTGCGMTRIGSCLYEHLAIFQFLIFQFVLLLLLCLEVLPHYNNQSSSTI